MLVADLQTEARTVRQHGECFGHAFKPCIQADHASDFELEWRVGALAHLKYVTNVTLLPFTRNVPGRRPGSNHLVYKTTPRRHGFSAAVEPPRTAEMSAPS